jgi:ribonuclease HII
MVEAGKTVIAGVDEAGRGAVIGPLVVAGVSIYPETEEEFRRLRIRDSKQIAPGMRKKLAKKIEELAKDIVIIRVEACKIDTYRKEGINLNRLEIMKFADVLNFLRPNKAYIDAPENPEKLKLKMRKMLQSEMEIIAEHKADNKYPVVGAASIVAKVARDDEIEELKKKHGDFGPGYPSNELTIKWMRDYLKEHKKFPECVRRTWVTTEEIKRDHQQSRLVGWLKRKD